MYKKIYRQEGGLAEEGYRAQIRQAREKAIADWKRRNRGEVAQRVRTPVARFIPQRGSSGLMALPKAIENLKGKDLSEIFNVGETQAGKALTRVNKLASDYYDPTKGDEGNLARHAGASRELANILTPPIPGGEFIGNIGANLGGIAEELRDLVERGSSHFPEALEDMKANYQGAPIFGGGRFPDAQTAEDIYEDVYGYKVDREGNRIVDEWGGLASLPEAQPTTNIEVPPEVAQNVDVSVTTPGYYDPKQPFKSNIVQYQDLTREEQKKRFEQDVKTWGEPATNYYNYLQNKPSRTAEENAHLVTLKTPVNMYKSGLGMPEIGPGSLRDAIYSKFGLLPEPISPPGQPTGFEGTGYEQFSPNPLDRPLDFIDMPRSEPDPNYTGPIIKAIKSTEGFQPETNLDNAFKPTVPQIGTPISMQNQSQAIPLGSPNIQGFKSKELAMSHAMANQGGGMVNVYQLGDGSWDYQRTGRPQSRALGLPITPGGPAL